MHKNLASPIAIGIILLFIGAAFFGRYLQEKNIVSNPHPQTAMSFEDCALLGYPIQETYPEICVTPEGRHFVNPSQVPPTPPEPTDRIAAGYIVGQVTIGPLCPVAYSNGEDPCGPLNPEVYTSRSAVVYTTDQHTIVTQTHLSADGTYKVALGPGKYYVQITPAGIGAGEFKSATVVSFQTTTVDFDIDTGIR